MNIKAVGVTCFATGIIFGFGIGFYFGKNAEKKEMEEKVRELRDHYNRITKCRENEEKKEEIYNKTISEYAGSEEKPAVNYGSAEKLVSKIISERKEVEKILAEGEHPEEEYDEDMSEDDIDREEWESKSIWASEKKDPYIITYDEFTDHPELDKISLIYYATDGTLATEEEEKIDDVYGTVGSCIKDSDFDVSDDRVMFIRNKRLGADFEITRFDGSFY